MTTTLIECPRCHGTAAVPLQASLEEALELLRQHGPSTPTQLRSHLRGVRVSALSNRLVELAHLGFVTSVKDGKHRIYTAVAVAGRKAPE